MRFSPSRRQSLALFAAALSMPAIARGAAKLEASQSDGIAAEREPFLDLMPDFWTVYGEPSSENLPERAQRLFDGFFRKHHDVYRLAGVETKLDDVVRWLPGFDGRAPAAHVVHMRFARDYAGNLGRFRSALPDFDDRASPVTLLPSLMHFDAHLQPNGSSLPLFFGPDAIVYFHGADADLAVLFSHELFHCYQGQMNPAMGLDPAAPLYASLWMEGTATYASERLNPSTSPLHVLLDDATLAHLEMSSMRAAAQAMLSHLDARDEATQSLFFETGHHGDGWPPRVAYAVGLQIARGLGAAMSLPQMAALPAPGVRETLAHALQRLA